MGEAFITRRGSSSKGVVGGIINDYDSCSLHLSELGFLPRHIEIQRLSPLSPPREYTITRVLWKDGDLTVWYYDDYSDGNHISGDAGGISISSEYNEFMIEFLGIRQNHRFTGNYCWVASRDII